MEEQWLYEAITGTYLPLMQMFEGLAHDHIPYRCTVSLSAPLITMLTDDLLKMRYAEHLDELIELTEKEIERTKPEPHYQRLAQMYRDRFASCATPGAATTATWCAPSASCRTRARLEVITSTATHAFFPLMDRNWAAMRAQVHTAADLYEKHFGRRPRGMWLGECGYVPGVDELLREAAIRYFFVDTHGFLFADTPPQYGVYAPLYCPSGVAAFGRDTESSEQVWSAKHGYPGDAHYRDFYRDIGFDLPLDYIGPHIHPEGHRLYTGIKYHAITHDQLHDKWVYDPDTARGNAGLHASHFRGNREKQVERLRGGMDRPPIIVSPYDAELYGHWWYEGPDLPRRRVPPAALRPARDRDDHARRLPGAPPHQPGGDAVRVVLGLQGLQRLLAEREQRLDVPPPARRRRAHGRAGAPLPRAEERARAARAEPGGARADAGAVERLDVHHDDRDHRPLRHPAHQPAHPPVQPALRRPARGPARRGQPSPTSRRRNNISRTSTTASTPADALGSPTARAS